VSSTQKAFKVLSVGDILGSNSTHNLAVGETATLTSIIPSGFTATTFLAAIRGLFSEWGGYGINGNGNLTSDAYPTYKSFSTGVTSGSSFDFYHQGGDYVKGQNLTFSSTAGALTLTGNSGFYVASKDVYNFADSGGSKTGNNGYEPGNLKLLYQFDTGNQDTTPTINVTYDGTKAAVGDKIELFEGTTLLGTRILTSADVGVANTTLGVDVALTLSSGVHSIVSKFTDTAGSTVSATAVSVNINGAGSPPTVTNLTVSGDGGVTNATLNDSATGYAVVAHNINYNVDKNLTFKGNVSVDSVVSVSLGGQQIGFASVSAGNFTLKAATNILKPGFYNDLTITVSDATTTASSGQTTVFSDYKLGWYYASQSQGNITGGSGNDLIMAGTSPSGTTIQTGAGNDIVTVGGFGFSSNLTKAISDFTLGSDLVKVNGQTVTAANLSSFVTASASGSSTLLSIDLDGAGAGTTRYNLTLTGISYDPTNTATIFGV